MLESAGRIDGKLPMVEEVLKKRHEARVLRAEREKRKQKAVKRQTYFVVGYSNFWHTPIHVVINRIYKCFGLIGSAF